MTGTAASPLDSLLSRGDSLYRATPDSAGVLYEQARQRAAASRDSAQLARALTGLGQVARVQGRLADSRRLGEEALALKLRLGMRPELFRSYNALGLLAWNEERLRDAAELFRQAAASARAMNDSAGLAKTMINTGLVLDDLGDFDGARGSYVAGRDAARAAGDTASLAKALTNLSSLDIRLGDPLAAIASLEDARRQGRAAGDSYTEVNALAQLATAHDALGEPQQAFAALDSALALARRNGLRVEEADDVKLLGDLYAGAGDVRRALDSYARAATLDDMLGRPEERGDALRNEARVQFAMGRADLAAQRADEALRVHRGGGFRTSELDDLVLLAELAEAAGRRSDADARLRSAALVAASLKVDVASAQVALGEARVADRAGDAQRVLRALDPGRLSLGVAGQAAVAEVLALRARAFAKLGRLDAAAAVGRQAVAAVERVRGNYASGALRTSYESDRMTVYVDLVLVLLRLGRTDEALEVADAARGRVLLEHLAAARSDVRAAPPAERALLDGERLLRRIDELTAKLQAMQRTNPRERTLISVASAGELADRLTEARGEYESLMARVPSADPAAAALLGGVTHASAIRASLEPDERLLEYFVTPERVLIFVVKRESVTYLQSPLTADELTARVRLARELLARRDADTAQLPVLGTLYDALMRPVIESGLLGEARRLIVVPHAVLTYLPFAALIDIHSRRYVVQDFTLLHLPSAAALGVMRGVEAERFAVTNRAAAVFAPFPVDLPATRREATSFRRAMPGAAMYVGGSASEARVRQALAGGAIVHLATHGEMNARNPLFSRLDLAAGRGGSSDDGRLEVRELLGLRFRSPLVFLSGCETGLGAAWSTQFETGEDYATIAQSLLYAGARSVVATLWRIDDAAAAEFAERFYRGFRAVGAREALAHAQREMLTVDRYRNPYYWAPYEVSGGEPIVPAIAKDGRPSVQR